MKPESFTYDIELAATTNLDDPGIIAMTRENAACGIVRIEVPTPNLDLATERRPVGEEAVASLGDNHESADDVRGAFVRIHKFILP